MANKPDSPHFEEVLARSSEICKNLKEKFENSEQEMSAMKAQLASLEELIKTAVTSEVRAEATREITKLTTDLQINDKNSSTNDRSEYYDEPQRIKGYTPNVPWSNGNIEIDTQKIADNEAEDQAAKFTNYWMTFNAYPPPKFEDYPIGKIGKCIIGDLEPDSSELCYIIDTESSHNDKVMKEMPNDPDLVEIVDAFDTQTGIKVNSGELIIIQTTDVLARGLVEREQNEVQIFLIDFGEYLSDIKDMGTVYRVSEKWQNVPALALLVKIEESTMPKVDFKNYDLVFFEVVDVKDHILYVKLYDKLPVEKKLTKKEIRGTDGLTNAERDMLFEETEGTSNAMVAVLGYNPTDDTRYCKYYDPNTGACFKGSNCRFIHQPIDKDGWTKDRRPIKLDFFKSLEVPAIGSQITLLPCFIVSINTFYAQMYSNEIANKPTLRLFQTILNKEENIKKYKKYNKSILPAEGELVLAKYKADGRYYRGKIRESNSDDTSYVVFFVDYGNCDVVHLNDLFQWQPDFELMPFQAVKFVIANITLRPGLSNLAGIDALRKAIVGKDRISATVLDNKIDIFVTISDGQMDIGEFLIITKKAIARELEFAEGSGFVPG